MNEWDDEVRSYLEANPQRSFKVKDLQRALRIPGARYREFRAHVLAMGRDGKIALLPRRRVQALSQAQTLEGLVEGVGGQATHVLFPHRDGLRLPLFPPDQPTVAAGDRVRARLFRADGVRYAQVRRVEEASSRRLLGSLMQVGDRWALEPDVEMAGLRGSIFIAAEAVPAEARDGWIARGRVPAFRPSTSRPELDEVVVLGPPDQPLPAIARRIARSGWPTEFGAEATAEAARPPQDSEGRRDLTADLVFTIDPIDARDHDDAVSIQRMADGGFRLGVHIADVAAFVPAGSALDAEARGRATSVYPPGSVLPMLPPALSAGECSLHHGVRRRCLSVQLDYDKEGRRTSIELGASWIRSRASLAYEHAEALLLGDPSFVPEDRTEVAPEDLAQAVEQMGRLSTLLREHRRASGSLFVDRPERQFVFGDDGHVVRVEHRASLQSHWLIEEFMLEANRAVAEVLDHAGLPLLWRVHESPDEDRVDDLVGVLEGLGVFWSPRQPIQGEDYEELFGLVRQREDARLIALLALRSLMKAHYTDGRQGHFGLAFDRYCHFTSPIRRYPDLHNQRWLHRLIEARSSTGWIRAEGLAAGRLRVPREERRLARELGEHCSQRERRATELERGAEDICAADSLRDHVGEELDGMVVSIVASGLFVELDMGGLDGFIGVEQLPGDWYTLDAQRHRFVGERSGRHFGLGQRVRVLLEHVDVSLGRVWLSSIESTART